jgi:NEDD8-activating enzyme E1 regulatory subunit
MDRGTHAGHTPSPPPPPQVALDLLLEMNPDVKGEYRVASPLGLVKDEPAFFKQFNIVVATQLAGEDATALATLLQEQGVPLVLARSYGLLGYVRTVVAEHTVWEVKAFSSVEDLRIANPFPALRALSDSVDAGVADELEHGHVPYIVLLIKALDRWRAAVSAAAPPAACPRPPHSCTIAPRSTAARRPRRAPTRRRSAQP